VFAALGPVFAELQVNVLVASSKAKVYAVGQAFLRNCDHGMARLDHCGFVPRQGIVASNVFPPTTQLGQPQQLLVLEP